MRFITVTGLALIIGILGYLLYTSFQPVHEPLDLLPLVKEEAQEKEESSNKEGLSNVEQPALWMERAEMSLVDRTNRLCWQLILNTVEKEEAFYGLYGVKGEYFPPEGGAFSVQAESGRVGKGFSYLRLEGKVVLSREDLIVEMEELEWEIAGDLLYGEKMILRNQDIEVFADRIQLDLNLERIKVDGSSRWEFGGG